MQQFPDVEYLAMARDIALTHHECFDGSGYPQGLRGTEIPISGRIVALADVYDALTSQRPYKAAYSHEVAKQLIMETVDRFDPRVLTAFLEVETEFIAIREAFSDATIVEETIPAEERSRVEGIDVPLTTWGLVSSRLRSTALSSPRTTRPTTRASAQA